MLPELLPASAPSTSSSRLRGASGCWVSAIAHRHQDRPHLHVLRIEHVLASSAKWIGSERSVRDRSIQSGRVCLARGRVKAHVEHCTAKAIVSVVLQHQSPHTTGSQPYTKGSRWEMCTRVVSAGISCAHRALHDHHILGLPDLRGKTTWP